MDDIRKNLPMSMIMAAFSGISWYIGAEINTSLFLLFKRRRGLYFWSCALTSWGVTLQPLFIILADFGVWRDPVPSITLIYLTWLIMVVPQSWVLYSRLHLLMHSTTLLRVIRHALLLTSVVFSVPTMVIGTLAQATTVNPALASINLVWDRVQLVVFFVQETALSMLYIYQTRKYLHGRAPLCQHSWSLEPQLPLPPTTTITTAPSPPSLDSSRHHNHHHHFRGGPRCCESAVLWQLVWANILIIALDVILLGIQCANMFHLQGAFKPCVYGVKLKLEFVILNRLIRTVRQPTASDILFSQGSEPSHHPHGTSTAPGTAGGHVPSRHQARNHGRHSSDTGHAGNMHNDHGSSVGDDDGRHDDSPWSGAELGHDKADVQLVATASQGRGGAPTGETSPTWLEPNAYSVFR